MTDRLSYEGISRHANAPALFLLDDENGDTHYKCPHCGNFGAGSAFDVVPSNPVSCLECGQCGSKLEYPL